MSELELIEFVQKIGVGRTFIDVLQHTFFYDKAEKAQRAAINKTQKLIKRQIFSRVNTGLESPRSALVFSTVAKEYVQVELGEKPKRGRIAATTVHHEIMLQKTSFWLQKIDNFVNLKRAEVADFQGFGHTPDLVLRVKNKEGKASSLWIEIETSHKSSIRYTQIFRNILAKNEGKLPFSRVVYVCKSERDLATISTKIPAQFKEFVMGTTIDELISNIANNGKICSKNIALFEAQK